MFHLRGTMDVQCLAADTKSFTPVFKYNRHKPLPPGDPGATTFARRPASVVTCSCQESLEARKVHLQTWRSWRRLAEGAWSWKTIDGSAEINFRSSSSECLSQSGGVAEFLCLFLVSMSVPVCVSGALFLRQSASRSCLIPQDGTELKMVETNIVEHGEQ